ncbi:MAG TPA: hypothetical protein VKN99_24025 [Polyangia bacterium]|nr:hypothetical protein [Polyangia bacterium]
MVCGAWIALLGLVATDPAAALKHAEALYADAQYPEAVAALDELLARRDLAPAARLEATLYLGMGQLALGNEQAARARFQELLEANPAYELPRYTSPKIRALFDQIRAQVQGGPRLEALPPLAEAAASGPGPVRLRFHAERLAGGGTQRALVYWRRSGQRDWSEIALAGQTELSAEPPLAATSEPATDFDLEYYAEIQEGPLVLAHAGTAAQPLVVHVPAPARGLAGSQSAAAPFYKRWWFWSAVGLVAVGGATAAYLGTRGGGAEPGALDIRFQVQ